MRGAPVRPPVEVREPDEFAHQVQDALGHLNDPIALQTHPLTRLLPHDHSAGAAAGARDHLGNALRRQLLEALATLRPAAGTSETAAGRGYRLLELRYVEAQDPRAVQEQLSLSRSQYYREHARAMEAVVSLLAQTWGVAPREPEPVMVAPPPAPLPAPVEAAPAAPPVPVPAAPAAAAAAEPAAAAAERDAARPAGVDGAGGDQPAFLWVTGIAAALSPLCLAGSALVLLASPGYQPAGQIPVGVSPEQVRTLWTFDLFGYFLLLVPAALYLWNALRPSNPALVTLYTAFGMAHLVIGAISTAILAAAQPFLISAYAQAAGGEREMLEAMYRSISVIIRSGLWGTLLVIMAGIWWLGIGFLLRRERPVFGAATVALGALSVGGAAGRLAGVDAVAQAGVWGYLVGTPLWALALGAGLLYQAVRQMRRARPRAEGTARAHTLTAAQES